jgi:hypothetical protein
MKRLIGFVTTFLVVSFLAVGLSGCPSSGVKPTQELSPLQDAYAVRDSIIIAKSALADARGMNKISKEAFDKARATLDDADRIVKAQIDSAHAGMVNTAALGVASAKVKEANTIAGTQ